MGQEMDEEKVRLDKWLWAARFFKTRSLASQAVAGGMVRLNGDRAKPSRCVETGNELRIRKAAEEFVVRVLAVSGQRRGAPEARLLYEESPESLAAREAAREERKLLRSAESAPPVRPGKRDRRLIRKFTRKDE